jgi:HEAT repeat protein
MSILPLLASALGRNDEVPNQDLAKQVVAKKNQQAVRELVDNLQSKNKDIRHDCIKVLYEIGVLNPKLISAYVPDFIRLLNDKSNRMQWGAMIALGSITQEVPEKIYTALPSILDAAEKGSVITKDHAVNILIHLCSVTFYAKETFVLLIGQLKAAPANQLPMYAEKSIPVINESNKQLFIETLRSRLGDIEKESKQKRVEKVIKKFSK